MIILRPTKMLAKRLSLVVRSEEAASVNPYADWSVHQFAVSRYRFLIAVNTRSLLPVVMRARGITTGSAFATGILEHIAKHLRVLGWGDLAERYLLPEMGSIALAPIGSRSLLGSINDLIYGASVHINAGDTLDEVNFRLKETPMIGYLEGASPERVFPRMVAS